MSAIDSLPPDQKAVLQLLLKQDKSYADLSKLLHIEPEAVRERALDAMDALGPEEAEGLDEQHQDQVADYLLGQSDADATAATHSFLEGSPGGRAWARAVSAELEPFAPAGLPAIPQDGDAAPEGDKPSWRKRTAAPAAVSAEGAPIADADGTDEDDDRKPAGAHAAGGRRSFKLGGALLLLGIAALLGLVLFVALKKDDADKTAQRPVSTPAASTSTPAGEPKVEQQINLTSPTEGSKSLGVANVVSQGGRRAIALIGQDIKPPGNRYAVWLINAKTVQFLGFAPPVKADGRLQGLAGTPENLSDFSEIIVTREQVDKPKKPGTIVLRGPLRES